MSVEARAGASGPSATTSPTFDLRALFAPRSIAVVGASPRSDLARTVRDNIAVVGGGARCYFVNPRYTEVDGTHCHPDIASLPEVPDCVVVGVNLQRTVGVMREAVAAGVPSVVIPGGGVVDGGTAAERMQAEVAALAIESGTAVLGPNCMGLIDLTTSSATYIDEIHPWLRRGTVAGIAQSGSVTNAFIHAGSRIGWSRIVSSGSEVVLDLCDYLALCIDDSETRAIALFVEGFKRPERFLALADRAFELDKPILAVKVGRSVQAQAAAVAHTGSLAGEERVVDAALRAAGVARFTDIDELLEAAALITGVRRLGRRVGKGRTGVVTVSTGEGSLIADLAPRTGLDFPPLPVAVRERIASNLPTLGYIGNPMDPWGADEAAVAYRSCLGAMAESGAYDVVVLVHDFPFRSQAGELSLATELAGILVATTADRPAVLPVFVSLTSGDVAPEVQDLLDDAGGIPILRGTVPAFAAIARLAWWEERRARRLAEGPARPEWMALGADRTFYGHQRHGAAGATDGPGIALPERESGELLRAAGVPVLPCVAVDENGAVAAAEAVGYPVTVKVDAPDVPHKSEIAGVAVGLHEAGAVREASARVIEAGRRAGATVRGVLVSKAVPPGVELIAGGRRDAQFGPVVLVGLGGVLAEILDDVAIRLAPVTEAVARAMLDEPRGSAVLRGVRGSPPVDVEAVTQLVVAIGRAMVAHPEWREVDLNPVIASETGAVAVDALVVLDAPVRSAHQPEEPT